MELITSLVLPTVLLNQDIELRSHSLITTRSSKNIYIHSSDLETKECNDLYRIFMIQLSETQCKQTHLISEDTCLHSMWNTGLLIHLTPIRILLTDMNIRIWTLLITTGNKAEIEIQRNSNMSEGKHSIFMETWSLGYLKDVISLKVLKLTQSNNSEILRNKIKNFSKWVPPKK